MTAATVKSTATTVNCAAMEAATTVNRSAAESATYCTAAETTAEPRSSPKSRSTCKS
jgi:hypothetical protein